MASIRKRSWHTAQGIERTAWIADYADQAGERHIKTFQTKKEADAWLVTAKAEIRDGLHTAASKSITIEAAGELWIKECEVDGLERSTVKPRRVHLERHIKPFIGKIKLCDLTAPRVKQFRRELRDGGRSDAMQRKVLGSLKTLIGFAMEQGLVAQNVAVGGRQKRRKGARSSSAAYDGGQLGPVEAGVTMPTKAELRAIIDAAAEMDAERAAAQAKLPPEKRMPGLKARPFIMVAIFTGMRASELRGLGWPHVDFERKLIRVRRRADAWGVMGPPKSKAGIRDIAMAPIVANVLREWRAACPKGELGLVFPTGKGTIQNHSNLWKRLFAPLQRRASVVAATTEKDENGEPIMAPKYGLHALRHAAASLFIEQGWTPKKVQTVMGHASIQMTFDLYGHLFPDNKLDAEAMADVEAAVLAG